jgi:hypothetical protein
VIGAKLTDSTTATPSPLTEVAKKLERYGFQLRRHTEKRVTFTSERTGSGTFRDGFTIPIAELETLAGQLDSDIHALTEHAGFFIPSSGYFEMAVRNISAIRPRTFEPYLRTSAPQDIICRHTTDASLPTVNPTEHASSIPRDPRRVQSLHVNNVGTDVCIEISWASPCGILWGVPNSRPALDEDYFSSTISLKIDFGTALPREALETKGRSLAYSFLYELNIRNGVSLEPLSLAEVTQAGSRYTRPERLPARFPTMRVQPEVAELFIFAEGARTNPSLAFLAYYQVLEYFFPFAIRRSAIKRVRKEVTDPVFNKDSDAALLRVLAIAESAVHTSESNQIAALISDSVRTDILSGFFADNEWASHFTKSGPISGVESINMKNTQKPLAAQVAERVYGIRNRIVHAKDDPKYGDVRVLLPKSREAYGLEPDIRLARLLATEVILDSQSS